DMDRSWARRSRSLDLGAWGRQRPGPRTGRRNDVPARSTVRSHFPMQTLSRGLARLLVLGGATLTALPAWAAAAQEKSLPGSTTPFTRTGEAASFRNALQESQFGPLLAAPALKPLLDDSGTKLDARAPRLGPNTRKTLRQLWDLAEGELTMAVVP